MTSLRALRVLRGEHLLFFLISTVSFSGEENEPISYTLSFPAPHTHYLEVEMEVPVQGRDDVSLMMALWTPGSYLIREYAGHVERISATTEDDKPLAIGKQDKNTWQVSITNASRIHVRYRLYCHDMSVRGNWIDHRFALLNGAPTFLTPTDGVVRPHLVRLALPADWTQSITSLAPAREGLPHEYRAPDFDTLVDSPIYAGNPAVYEFEVGNKRHLLVNEGEGAIWDGRASVRDVEKIVAEHQRMWGTVPYDRYIFFNLITEGRGGLEHDNSTVMMTSRWKYRVRKDYIDWLGLVSHEFFHTWNIRRLRPKTLVEYDYSGETYTPSLWIAEGITSYYDDLALVRAKLCSEQEYLERLSKSIEKLQTTPGRLIQSLEEASHDAWIKFYRPNENSTNSTISYYIKGAVVAFLLDAKIRRATHGEESLDGVMRLFYERFWGKRGYAPKDFRKTVTEVVGSDLLDWFKKALGSTEELDYEETLAWYGLVFKEAKKEERPPKIGTEVITENRSGLDSKKAWLGADTKNSDGRLIISKVIRGSPAFESGLNVSDEIVALGEYRVLPQHFKDRLKHYSPGDRETILVARRGKLLRIDVAFGEEPKKKWSLSVSPDATAEQKAHLKAWLQPRGQSSEIRGQ